MSDVLEKESIVEVFKSEIRLATTEIYSIYISICSFIRYYLLVLFCDFKIAEQYHVQYVDEITLKRNVLILLIIFVTHVCNCLFMYCGKRFERVASIKLFEVGEFQGRL